MLWQEWSKQGLNAMGKLVADIIVETLQNAGVKHCYGVVGDTLNLIARSLEKSEIEWVSVRHEEAGARRRSLGIDVLAPYLRSCIAVVGEPKLLNLQER
jgi:hypothetical protein